MSHRRYIQNHKGRFLLSTEIIEDGMYASRIQHIMSYMIIIRCDRRFDLDGYEYVAYSWLFKELPGGSAIAPLYEIIARDDGWKIEAVMQ